MEHTLSRKIYDKRLPIPLLFPTCGEKCFLLFGKIALESTVHTEYTFYMQQCSAWCLSTYYVKATVKNFPNQSFHIKYELIHINLCNRVNCTCTTSPRRKSVKSYLTCQSLSYSAEFRDCLVLTLPGYDSQPCPRQATNLMRQKYIGPLFSSVMHNIAYSERRLPL